MIGSSKNNRENYPKNAFEHKKKKPGLSANRPSNNWALMVFYIMEAFFLGSILKQVNQYCQATTVTIVHLQH